MLLNLYRKIMINKIENLEKIIIKIEIYKNKLKIYQ